MNATKKYTWTDEQNATIFRTSGFSYEYDYFLNKFVMEGPTKTFPRKPKSNLKQVIMTKKTKGVQKRSHEQLHAYLVENFIDTKKTIDRDVFLFKLEDITTEDQALEKLKRRINLKLGLINFKKEDWSILAYLYPVVKNKQRVTNYKEYEDEISMRGIEYPVAKEDIPKVEKQNNLIINVFALKDQTNKQTLDPIYVSNKESEKCYVVDLLYIENNGNAHYCLIKNLDSFMCDNNGHKQFTCRNCIQGFQREETLEKTKKYVMITNLVEP
ncbi:unnamed protein product [Mytilus coruscus]|uniref:Uncharacterized protein n=1 Tax=Mytilus coruscus TaxID=42192 RepID=A0A6J8BQL4_MYTCO|nr:unnamed protein product [Mytilus coruscus]